MRSSASTTAAQAYYIHSTLLIQQLSLHVGIASLKSEENLGTIDVQSGSHRSGSDPHMDGSHACLTPILVSAADQSLTFRAFCTWWFSDNRKFNNKRLAGAVSTLASQASI